MTEKPKPRGNRPPAKPPAKQATGRPPTTATHGVSKARNPLRQAENRWQRTIRYGWDKGGAKGGR